MRRASFNCSCAINTLKKAATVCARRSARTAERSAIATPLARSAAVTRAARLPPSSMGMLIVPAVVRVSRRVSCKSMPSSGLGLTPAWMTPPCMASTSLTAAASPRLRAAVKASAA